MSIVALRNVVKSYDEATRLCHVKYKDLGKEHEEDLEHWQIQLMREPPKKQSNPRVHPGSENDYARVTKGKVGRAKNISGK